jgi:hypothetical protein
MTKDEIQIRFWRDRWVGQTPFKYHFQQFPAIAHDPHALEATVMSVEHYNILFRRALVDDKL